MEYERTPDGQIQADFAFRIGRIAEQYERFCKSMLPEEERYEATMLLALLHALLTNCAESLNRKPEKTHPALNQVAKRNLDQDPTLLGFQRSSVVQQWPSTRPLMYLELLYCLRNAMSHPCPQTEEGLPRTGYTSWQSDSGVIEGFTFTQSPWVNSTGKALKPDFMPVEGDKKKEEALRKAMKNFEDNNCVPDLSVRSDGKGRLRVFHLDEPFVPVLRIKLDIEQLRMLTMSLSEYLASPLELAQQQMVMHGSR